MLLMLVESTFIFLPSGKSRVCSLVSRWQLLRSTVIISPFLSANWNIVVYTQSNTSPIHVKTVSHLLLTFSIRDTSQRCLLMRSHSLSVLNVFPYTLWKCLSCLENQLQSRWLLSLRSSEALQMHTFFTLCSYQTFFVPKDDKKYFQMNLFSCVFVTLLLEIHNNIHQTLHSLCLSVQLQ